MLAATAASLVALALPVWGAYAASPVQAARAISDRIPLFTISVVVWSVTFVLGGAGVAFLGSVLRRNVPAGSVDALVVGLVGPLFAFGMAGYVLSRAIVAPALIAVADSSRTVASLEPSDSIAHAIWTASSAGCALAIALLVWALARGSALPRWTAVVFAAWALTAAALLVATGDLPPFLFFLLTLPAPGIAVLRSAASSRHRDRAPAAPR
jgi:hypothetical protein